MVKWYSFKDIGAPILSGTQYSMDNLIYACMVTGYGNKTGAGWTRQTSIANGDSLYKIECDKPSYVRITDISSVTYNPRNCSISMYRNADMSYCWTNNRIIGIRKAALSDSTPREWDLFTNGEIVYLFTEPFDDNTKKPTLTIFGRYRELIDISYPHVLIGRQLAFDTFRSEYAGYVGCRLNVNNQHGQLACDWQNNLLDTQVWCDVITSNYFYNNTNYVMGSVNELATPAIGTKVYHIDRLYLCQESFGIVGRLSGMWHIHHSKPFSHSSSYTTVLDGISRTLVAYNLYTNGQVFIETSDTWDL